MTSANIVDDLTKDIEERLTLDGKNRVFNEGKELRSEFMNEEAEPEAFTREFLIDKIFSALELEKLPEKKIEDSRGLRSVDYRIKSKERMFLVEAKPLNADLFEKSREGGVNQIKGLFRLAEVKENYDFGVATNGLRWVFVDRTGKIVDDLRLEADFAQIKEFLVGKEKVVSPKTEEEISKKFYDWYNALLHGGRYKNHENKLKTVAEDDCLVNNIIGVKDLEEREQIAQVVMNRLIFIKFLQSKGIIGEDILRFLAETKEDMLTPKLRQLFFGTLDRPVDDRFDIDERFKDIPYLNGSLFVHTEVERKNIDYKVRAEILKEVIAFLDSFKFVHKEQFENENSIDPEILGYIFERAMTARDRKGTGAYYTPKPITKYISENTIYPCIIEKTNEILKTEKGYKDTELIKDIEELFILPATTLKEVWDKVILKLRILDNACGSGAFLLAAANILFELNKKINDKLGAENLDTTLKILILVNNLYGVDINPNGIEIAKLRLWLWLADSYEPGYIKPLPNIDYNLRVGNSLIGYVDLGEFKGAKLTISDFLHDEEKPTLDILLKERNDLIREYKITRGEEAKELKESVQELDGTISNLLNAELYRKFREKRIKISKEEFLKLSPFHWGFEFYEVFALDKPKEERGFDVVIGNPPYVQKNAFKDFEKTIIKKDFEENSSNMNIAAIFINQTNRLNKKTGYHGMIVPKSLLFSKSWLGDRKRLLERLVRLIDVSKAFKDVLLEQVIYVANKGEKEVFYYSQKYDGINFSKYSVKISKELANKFGILITDISTNELEIFNKIRKNSFLLGGITKTFSGIPYQSKLSHVGDVAAIGGKEIGRYSVKGIKGYFCQNFLNSLKGLSQFKQEKIISQRIIAHVTKPKDRIVIMSSYDEKGTITVNTVSNTILKEKKYNLKTILLLLNSVLTSWFAYHFIYAKAVRSMDLYDYFIGKILVSKLLSAQQQPFIHLCNYMLFLNETEERRKTEKEHIEFIDKQVIDSLVYELYFKEKFEEEGLKTNLLRLVEHHLKDVDALKFDEEKLEGIKEVVEGIKSDGAIMGQIGRVKNHEWVKVIEGGEKWRQ